MSQLYNLLELLKQHVADKSKKGVVGNTGNIMPISPINKDDDPIKISNILLIKSPMNMDNISLQKLQLND